MGALAPLSAPIWCAVLGLGAVVIVRRRLPTVVAVAVAASVLASHSLSGLTPLPPGPWRGEVTLVADPTERGSGTTVDVRTARGRVEVTAWGAAGRVLAECAAGDHVVVEGTLGPVPNPSRVRWRHIRARLHAARVVRTHRTEWWMRAPNAIRSAILTGSTPLPTDQRPVYAGFVLGDDRGRSEDITRWFESAGLLHLLVVSGENVAFLLLVLGPVLSRFPRRTRFVVTCSVLALFAAVTRFEPSVLRATVMAAIAAAAVMADRRSDGRRILAIAVTALVLVDPMLVHSIGFVLSVSAAAGIVVLAPSVERRLRGPRSLRTPVAVTIAAQLAVAPVIVPIFGPLPLIAVPANVLAEPVAGLVMMWGSTAGIVAGILGGPVAAVLQFPTRVGLGWIIGVARLADRLPQVGAGLGPIIAVVLGAVVVGLVRRRRPPDPMMGNESTIRTGPGGSSARR